METLYKFIQTTLSEKLSIFKGQIFKNALKHYQERYCQHKRDIKLWEKERQAKDESWAEINPAPVPLLLGGSYRDERDTRAMAAALLACLHDLFLLDEIPVIPKDWPDDIKQFLKKNVEPRYKNKMREWIDTYWGSELKKQIIRAIEKIENQQKYPQYGKHRQDGFFVLDLSKMPSNEISQNISIATELRELSILALMYSEYTENKHHEQHGDNIMIFQNNINHIIAAVKTQINNSQSDVDKAIYIKTEAKLSNIAQEVSREKSHYGLWIKKDNIQAAMRTAKYFYNSIKPLASELDNYSYEIEALPEVNKTSTANNKKKRGGNILNQQVGELLKCSPQNISAQKIANTLNITYKDVHYPITGSAVEKTDNWKHRRGKKKSSKKK